MALGPGDRVLLLLKIGDRAWREVVVLDERDGTFHHVLTPSRAVRRTDFSDQNVRGIVMLEPGKLPSKIKRSDIFLALDSVGGD